MATSPIPGFDAYAQASLVAKTAYQNALARLNSQRSGTLRQYGYLGDIDPGLGTIRNVRVDPNNPYGMFQSLLSQGATAAQAAEDEAQQRGLGKGGLAAQLLNRAKFEFGGQSAALGSNLMGALSALQQQQSDAKYDYDRALYEAQLEAARLAIEQQQFNPPGTSGDEDPPMGSNDPPGTGGPPGPTSPYIPLPPDIFKFTPVTPPPATYVPPKKKKPQPIAPYAGFH